jgi:DNA invertase Pin-like site-specific DNA recombinase
VRTRSRDDELWRARLSQNGTRVQDRSILKPPFETIPIGGILLDVRAAAYIRVSSKSQTLDMQRSAIERAARARRDTIADWYSDKLSARTLSRPGLERLRQAARESRVPRLYVYRLDRLARSGIRDTFEVIEDLRAHQCELITVADGFDLEGPAAEVVLAVMAWAAKMERLAINERIAAARARLEQEGRSWGRPPRLSPLERARIERLRQRGKTIREIAIAVHVPHATVGRALSHNSPPPARSARPARKRAAVARR